MARKTNFGLGGKPFPGEGKLSSRDYGSNNANESCTKDKVSYPRGAGERESEPSEPSSEKTGY